MEKKPILRLALAVLAGVGLGYGLTAGGGQLAPVTAGRTLFPHAQDVPAPAGILAKHRVLSAAATFEGPLKKTSGACRKLSQEVFPPF